MRGSRALTNAAIATAAGLCGVAALPTPVPTADVAVNAPYTQDSILQARKPVRQDSANVFTTEGVATVQRTHRRGTQDVQPITVSTSIGSSKQRTSSESRLSRRASTDSSLERRDKTAEEKKAEKEFKQIVLPVWLGCSAVVVGALGYAAHRKGVGLLGMGGRREQLYAPRSAKI